MSIMKTEKGTCYVCGRRMNTEVHHIFGAANRRRSDKDGLTINVCRECHNLIHTEYDMNVLIKRQGEMVWCKTYGKTIEQFVKEYGKNYIW